MLPISKWFKYPAVVLATVLFVEPVAFAAPDLQMQFGSLSAVPGRIAMPLPFELPQAVASLEESFAAPKPNGSRQNPSTNSPTLYLIQDAHTNASAQKNIARTLDAILTANPDIRYVFSEAGSGDASLGFMKPYATQATREQVGSSFLNKGLLHGSEYYSLTGDRDFTLFGVEDPALYDKALEQYRAVAKSRPVTRNYLAQIRRTLDTLKSLIFAPALSDLDAARTAYLKEELPLTDYLQKITASGRSLGVSLRPYPALKRLDRLRSLEKTIDFAQTQTDHQKALESLSPEDRRELQAAHDALPKRLTGDSAATLGYFLLLEEKLTQTKQSLSVEYPQLYKYLRYLKAYEKLDPVRVLDEQKALEEAVFKTLARTPGERDLLLFSRNLETLEHLFDLKLSPDEYRRLQDDPKTHDITLLTGFLNRKIMDMKSRYELTVFLEQRYPELYKEALAFYRTAYDRDQAFLNNLMPSLRGDANKPSSLRARLRRVKQSPKEPTPRQPASAILITGGFHTPHLKELLKQNNISYYSILPQVTHPTDTARYEKILLNQPPVQTDTAKSAIPHPSAAVESIATRLSGATSVDLRAALNIPVGLQPQPSPPAARLAEAIPGFVEVVETGQVAGLRVPTLFRVRQNGAVLGGLRLSHHSVDDQGNIRLEYTGVSHEGHTLTIRAVLMMDPKGVVLTTEPVVDVSTHGGAAYSSSAADYFLLLRGVQWGGAQQALPGEPGQPLEKVPSAESPEGRRIIDGYAESESARELMAAIRRRFKLLAEDSEEAGTFRVLQALGRLYLQSWDSLNKRRDPDAVAAAAMALVGRSDFLRIDSIDRLVRDLDAAAVLLRAILDYGDLGDRSGGERGGGPFGYYEELHPLRWALVPWAVGVDHLLNRESGREFETIFNISKTLYFDRGGSDYRPQQFYLNGLDTPIDRRLDPEQTIRSDFFNLRPMGSEEAAKLFARELTGQALIRSDADADDGTGRWALVTREHASSDEPLSHRKASASLTIEFDEVAPGELKPVRAFLDVIHCRDAAGRRTRYSIDLRSLPELGPEGLGALRQMTHYFFSHEFYNWVYTMSSRMTKRWGLRLLSEQPQPEIPPYAGWRNGGDLPFAKVPPAELWNRTLDELRGVSRPASDRWEDAAVTAHQILTAHPELRTPSNRAAFVRAAVPGRWYNRYLPERFKVRLFLWLGRFFEESYPDRFDQTMHLFDLPQNTLVAARLASVEVVTEAEAFRHDGRSVVLIVEDNWMDQGVFYTDAGLGGPSNLTELLTHSYPETQTDWRFVLTDSEQVANEVIEAVGSDLKFVLSDNSFPGRANGAGRDLLGESLVRRLIRQGIPAVLTSSEIPYMTGPEPIRFIRKGEDLKRFIVSELMRDLWEDAARQLLAQPPAARLADGGEIVNSFLAHQIEAVRDAGGLIGMSAEEIERFIAPENRYGHWFESATAYSNGQKVRFFAGRVRHRSRGRLDMGGDQPVELKRAQGGIRVLNVNMLTSPANPNHAIFHEKIRSIKADLTGDRVKDLTTLNDFTAQWLMEESEALAINMTLKSAVMGLPLGGAKGVIFTGYWHRNEGTGEWELLEAVDSRSEFAKRDLAWLVRDVARDFAENGIIHENLDGGAPDVSPYQHVFTTDQMMAIFLDETVEYEMERGDYPILRQPGLQPNLLHQKEVGDPTEWGLLNALVGYAKEHHPDAVFPFLSRYTGKPVGSGGSEYRAESTGDLAVEATLEQLRILRPDLAGSGSPLRGLRVGIQGFGGAGRPLALSLAGLGAEIVAISDIGGAIIKDGDQHFTHQDIQKLRRYVSGSSGQSTIVGIAEETRERLRVDGISKVVPGSEAGNEAVLSYPVDILFTAALEGALHRGNIGAVKAFLIVNVANGGTTPEAIRMAFERPGDKKVYAMPSALTSAGGVTLSYAEMTQNLINRYGDAPSLRRWAVHEMQKAVRGVWQTHQNLGVDLSRAAIALAMKRLRSAAASGDEPAAAARLAGVRAQSKEERARESAEVMALSIDRLDQLVKILMMRPIPVNQPSQHHRIMAASERLVQLSHEYPDRVIPAVAGALNAPLPWNEGWFKDVPILTLGRIVAAVASISPELLDQISQEVTQFTRIGRGSLGESSEARKVLNLISLNRIGFVPAHRGLVKEDGSIQPAVSTGQVQTVLEWLIARPEAAGSSEWMDLLRAALNQAQMDHLAVAASLIRQALASARPDQYDPVLQNLLFPLEPAQTPVVTEPSAARLAGGVSKPTRAVRVERMEQLKRGQIIWVREQFSLLEQGRLAEVLKDATDRSVQVKWLDDDGNDQYLNESSILQTAWAVDFDLPPGYAKDLTMPANGKVPVLSLEEFRAPNGGAAVFIPSPDQIRSVLKVFLPERQPALISWYSPAFYTNTDPLPKVALIRVGDQIYRADVPMWVSTDMDWDYILRAGWVKLELSESDVLVAASYGSGQDDRWFHLADRAILEKHVGDFQKNQIDAAKALNLLKPKLVRRSWGARLADGKAGERVVSGKDEAMGAYLELLDQRIYLEKNPDGTPMYGGHVVSALNRWKGWGAGAFPTRVYDEVYAGEPGPEQRIPGVERHITFWADGTSRVFALNDAEGIAEYLNRRVTRLREAAAARLAENEEPADDQLRALKLFALRALLGAERGDEGRWIAVLGGDGGELAVHRDLFVFSVERGVNADGERVVTVQKPDGSSIGLAYTDQDVQDAKEMPMTGGAVSVMDALEMMAKSWAETSQVLQNRQPWQPRQEVLVPLAAILQSATPVARAVNLAAFGVYVQKVKAQVWGAGIQFFVSPDEWAALESQVVQSRDESSQGQLKALRTLQAAGLFQVAKPTGEHVLVRVGLPETPGDPQAANYAMAAVEGARLADWSTINLAIGMTADLSPDGTTEALFSAKASDLHGDTLALAAARLSGATLTAEAWLKRILGQVTYKKTESFRTLLDRVLRGWAETLSAVARSA